MSYDCRIDVGVPVGSEGEGRRGAGCINVPVNFVAKVIGPAFTGTNGIVYVLPETRFARDVFGSCDIPDAPAPVASNPAAPAAR